VKRVLAIGLVGAALLMAAVSIGVRFDGGPLFGNDGGGAHLPAGLAVGRSFDVYAPAPAQSFEGTIERAEVVEMTPGLAILGVYVLSREAWDVTRVLKPPARVAYEYCCEPQPLFVIRLQVLDPGPHSIDALAIDYRSGLFAYRTRFRLSDLPLNDPPRDSAGP